MHILSELALLFQHGLLLCPLELPCTDCQDVKREKSAMSY